MSPLIRKAKQTLAVSLQLLWMGSLTFMHASHGLRGAHSSHLPSFPINSIPRFGGAVMWMSQRLHFPLQKMVTFQWVPLPEKLFKIGWPPTPLLSSWLSYCSILYLFKLWTRTEELKNGKPQGATVATVNSLPPDTSLHENKYLSYSGHHNQVSYK